MVVLGAILTPFAEVSFFRIEQEKIWLKTDVEPLSRLLERFAKAGVAVEVDPSVQKTVSGEWEGEEIEDVFDQILIPFDYFLDWQQAESPLSIRTQLAGIRVYREGHAAAVQPLKPRRQIVTSLDGRVRFLSREILIGFSSGSTDEDLRSLLAGIGGSVIAASPELGIYRIFLPEGTNIPDLVNQLKLNPKVAQSEPNYIYDLPRLFPEESPASGVVPHWRPPGGDSPVAVAVLDSGLLLSERLSSSLLGAFDATNPGRPLVSDAVGHGTQMAQLAAGLVDPYGSSVGEGVPVLAVKAFADDGSADSFSLMNAVTYAVKNSDGPISLSWGTETPSRFLETAMQYALDEGALLFAAVGNEPSGEPMYPAAYPQVLGVAASAGDRLADYSNRGDFVDLIAPGSAGGSQGTSVATAYVSHLAALYMRHNPGATAKETITALREAAGDDGFLTEEAVRQLLAE